MTDSEKPNILIIDSSYLIFRSFFAYPNLTFNERSLGAFYGYVKTILKLVKQYNPEHLFITGDLPEPTWRHKILESYKAGRPELDPNLIAQFPLINDWAKLISSQYLVSSGYEADDIIYNLAEHYSELAEKVIIFSSDKDLYQILTRENVYFVRNDNLYGVSEFKTEFNLEPSQWVDYKSIIGDKSDNLRGVAGIGPKGASELLQKSQNILNLLAYLDNTLEDQTLKEFLDSKPRLMSKIQSEADSMIQTFMLAKLQIVPDLIINPHKFDLLNGLETIRELGFNSIVRELTGESVEKSVKLEKPPKPKIEDYTDSLF
jgi:DNA polymerase I